LNYTALSCRHVLEDFAKKIEKYETSLGTRAQPSTLRGVTAKVRWGMEEKSEVQNLRERLNAHNGSVNTLLAQLGLERMEVGFSRLECSSDRVVEITNETHCSVTRIESSVEKHESLLSGLSLSIPRLFSVLAKDFGASLEQAIQILSRLWYVDHYESITNG
jgi:hypothetical protein